MTAPPTPALRALFAAGGQLQAEVTLPAPPSANNLFATVGRKRVKTAEYRAWLKTAVPLLALLAPPASYPARYRLTLAGKWNIQRDGANAEKAAVDATVEANVIPDDSLKYLQGGEWTYEPGDGKPTVTVSFALARGGEANAPSDAVTGE